jgi:hypothetical protein
MKHRAARGDVHSGERIVQEEDVGLEGTVDGASQTDAALLTASVEERSNEWNGTGMSF